MKVQPILKWPGGKRLLLPVIRTWCPERYNRYFEPFVGAGALFFSLRPKKSILGDINPELMNFYRQARHDPAALIRSVMRLKNSEPTYYRVRASEPRSLLGQAARFFYLNKTCFNGLYRTNRDGRFNVPYGNNGRRVIPDMAVIFDASKLLRHATLRCADFVTACGDAERNDLVYLDPPYTVAHENNGFLRYNASLFTWHDQLRLRDLVGKLDRSGVRFILTNASHPSLEKLYKGYRQARVQRVSLLSAKVSARRVVSELLITNV